MKKIEGVKIKGNTHEGTVYNKPFFLRSEFDPVLEITLKTSQKTYKLEQIARDLLNFCKDHSYKKIEKEVKRLEKEYNESK